MLPGSISNRFSKVFLFAFCLFIFYLILFLSLDRLSFPPIWDEPRFWQVSLSFSHRLLPDLSQLKDYTELNTPLPFIVFGIIEYLFKQGIAGGRILNFILSFILVLLIGIPIQRRFKIGILSAVGLLIFPYFLWLSAHLYTDIIAAFFAFLGVWFYLRDRHIWGGLSFVLAIASRQFMLAFPISIVLYEITSNFKFGKPIKFELQPLLRVVAPAVAASTILGWIWLFEGLAPKSGLENNPYTPPVQQSTLSFDPASSLYFLACLGLYFVIPEWILFSRKFKLKSLLTPKNGWIAMGLLLLFICFPLDNSHGILSKLANTLPGSSFKVVNYVLALLACIRFSQINFAFWLILANCLLMLKAFPWDKYTLPLVAILWYLKSINWLDPKPGLLSPLLGSPNYHPSDDSLGSLNSNQ